MIRSDQEVIANQEGRIWVVFLYLSVASKAEGLSAKTMSDNAPQTKDKYDVFVSFRGEDIRDGFLSHLAAAFRRKKINAFVDDKLQRGEEIWPSLVGAIEGSLVSVIIFSEDYASSRWCLSELVKILECRDKYEQTVIPVFYRVDPTNVRNQTGSYNTAFVEHGKKINPTMLQIWSDALKKSADLSGIKSSDSQNDAELLDNITNDVLHHLRRLSKHTLNSKGLVGVGKSIADIEALLLKDSKDVRIIGIWGMGGIGKTTIAEQVFSKICSEYEGSCFLSNVREESTRHGINNLKEKLFATLLAEDVKMKSPNGLSDDIGRRISRMKVLIVLDDVNDSDQLELFGTVDNFGQGSRIIITTRDKQLLLSKEVDDIMEVGVLTSGEALELFNLIALNQSQLEMEYYELTERVVKYANGIPLVLKVLGHLLCGKDKKAWESQLDKLMEMPSKKVYDVMILSYHDLDRKEKRIFLDLACFFKGLNFKVDLIKTLLKDCESDNSVAQGLEMLKDKALIVISEDGVVSMHDIIEEIAWEIVRQESREDIGSQSRLGGSDDINKVLENDKGNEVVRSIRMHSSTKRTRKLKLNSQIFTKMSKLQFVDILDYDDLLSEGLKSLPTELRYLRWWQYPLKSLPKKFCAEKLVILDLSHSNVRRLWHGVQNLVNLKQVKLYHCTSLKELPNFSKATNLEEVNANHCYSLSNVHPSIFTLDKLEKFELSHCNSLTSLTSNAQLSCLSHLLCNSRFWEELPEISKATNLKVLDASGCDQLTNVHPSVFSLDKLEKLDLSYCSSLTSLTSNAQLSCLSYLNLEWCENLTEFSVTSENMVELNLKRTRITALPLSFGSQRKLEKLDLSNCSSLTSLTSNAQLSCLSYLNLEWCENLTEFSVTLENMVELNLARTRITALPLSFGSQRKLEKLDLSYCSSLTSLTSNAQLSCLSYLKLRGCYNLTEFSVTSENLVELNLKRTRITALPLSFGSQRKLEILNLQLCHEIESLPSCMANLTRLRYLDLRNCLKLHTLPELPPSVETLLIQGCCSLETVLFPSTATKQFQENKKRAQFFDCESLDEHSLMAIGLNARINVMKFAHQHLTDPKHDCFENYDDYFHKYDSYQAVHIFPRSRVPEWFEYHTMGDSVIIDLSSPPTSPPFGFIFCFVFDAWFHFRFMNVRVTISDSSGEDNSDEDDAGEDEKDTVEVSMSLNSVFTGDGDHVCVMYDHRCSRYLSRRSHNLSRFQIKVTPWWLQELGGGEQRLESKGFGVSLISTSKYDSFVRQKEMHDSWVSMFH